MKKFNSERLRKGFTLAELVIVMAILAILVCIGFVMANPRDFSVVEYNRCAESIATAAQNRLTALRNAGQLATLNALGDVSDLPKEGEVTSTGASDGYRYVFSYVVEGGSYKANDSMRFLVPTGSIDLELENGYYAVGFQAQSGMVGEVFFSKKPLENRTVEYLKDLSDLVVKSDGSIDVGAKKRTSERKRAEVGYYVGNVDVQEVAPAQLPTPQLTITNYEELTLSIYLPKVNQLTSDKYKKKLALRVSLADADGLAYVGVEDKDNPSKSKAKLTLDDTAIYRTDTDHNVEVGLEMGKILQHHSRYAQIRSEIRSRKKSRQHSRHRKIPRNGNSRGVLRGVGKTL